MGAKHVMQSPELSRRLAAAVNSPAFSALSYKQQEKIRTNMQKAMTEDDLSPQAKEILRQAEAGKKA